MSDTLKNRSQKASRLANGHSGVDEVSLANGIHVPANRTTDDPTQIADKLKRVASDRGAKGDELGQSYYFYHAVLVLLYLCMAVIRAWQYSYNKIKLRFLTLAYNPSKTPLLINEDINKLAKIPKHVSTILDLKPEEDENGGIDGLLNDSSEVVTWCLCSGIQELSIYEKQGSLKRHVPEFRRAIYKKLISYFGVEEAPTVAIKIPHLSLIYYGFDDEDEIAFKEGSKKADIEVTLLSVIDGRSTIVDLTKICGELVLKKELRLDDIKIQFIDKELTELVGPEPDLLILFQPSLDLQGYPPWHIRLSEIYWEQDNDQVDYSVFYRAFKKFSTCKVNVGK